MKQKPRNAGKTADTTGLASSPIRHLPVSTELRACTECRRPPIGQSFPHPDLGSSGGMGGAPPQDRGQEEAAFPPTHHFQTGGWEVRWTGSKCGDPGQRTVHFWWVRFAL